MTSRQIETSTPFRLIDIRRTSDRSDLGQTSSEVDSQSSLIFRKRDLDYRSVSIHKSLVLGNQGWPTSGGTRVQPNEAVASTKGMEKVEVGI